MGPRFEGLNIHYLLVIKHGWKIHHAWYFPTKSPLIGGFHLAMRTTGGKSWKSPASSGSADPKCWRLRHCQRKTWWLWLVRWESQEPQCHRWDCSGEYRFPKDLGLKIWVKPPKSHCENQISCVKICNKCIQMPWNGYPMVSPIFVDEDLSSKKWNNNYWFWRVDWRAKWAPNL